MTNNTHHAQLQEATSEKIVTGRPDTHLCRPRRDPADLYLPGEQRQRLAEAFYEVDGVQDFDLLGGCGAHDGRADVGEVLRGYALQHRLRHQRVINDPLTYLNPNRRRGGAGWARSQASPASPTCHQRPADLFKSQQTSGRCCVGTLSSIACVTKAMPVPLGKLVH